MNYEIDLFKKKYIKYKSKYITSKQKGGDTEQLLKKMRDHKGEFVLVIGSSNDQPHCLEFSNSPENLDKMVVSIDTFFIKSDNNFNIDFNIEENWKILHEFDGRFRTIIFDIFVDTHVDRDIDIYKHIKQLLIVGGKMYKYFSYGFPNIPAYIQSELITRPFIETDISIIKTQCQNIPDNILKLLQKIQSIQFIETPYGLLGFNNTYEKLGLNSIDWQIRDTASNDVLWYIKSLNQFFANRTYANLLQNVYNFDIQFFSKCIDYPLKYPSFDPRPRYKDDMCFVVCTKK
jgi:hypothetical protein